MRMSATLLGRQLGLSAREMNELLCLYGYLSGGPGDYSLTDKGKQYGHEKHEHRGPGGYAQYNRDWTTRSWDEEVLAALAKDMESGPPSETVDMSFEQPDPDEELVTPDRERRDRDDERHGVSVGPPGLWVAVAGVTVLVAVASYPVVRRWFGETVKPQAKRMWRKLASSESIASNKDDSEEGVPGRADLNGNAGV